MAADARTDADRASRWMDASNGPPTVTLVVIVVAVGLLLVGPPSWKWPLLVIGFGACLAGAYLPFRSQSLRVIPGVGEIGELLRRPRWVARGAAFFAVLNLAVALPELFSGSATVDWMFVAVALVVGALAIRRWLPSDAHNAE